MRSSKSIRSLPGHVKDCVEAIHVQTGGRDAEKPVELVLGDDDGFVFALAQQRGQVGANGVDVLRREDGGDVDHAQLALEQRVHGRLHERGRRRGLGLRRWRRRLVAWLGLGGRGRGGRGGARARLALLVPHRRRGDRSLPGRSVFRERLMTSTARCVELAKCAANLSRPGETRDSAIRSSAASVCRAWLWTGRFNLKTELSSSSSFSTSSSRAMPLHTTTRIEGDGVPAFVLPEPVKEALAMIESTSPLVTSEGFAKLSHATFNHPMCKETAGEVGAIQTIVAAMARNLDNASVQEDGCHALRNVVFHCEPNLTFVREQGGIQAVLDAMKAHPENEAVQAEGCWALVVFCSNHDDNIAAVKPFLPVIENASSKHSTNSDIASKCLFLKAVLA